MGFGWIGSSVKGLGGYEIFREIICRGAQFFQDIMDKTIAIIGAGPAGSMLAYKLASSDKRVLLYDHKAPWECSDQT